MMGAGDTPAPGRTVIAPRALQSAARAAAAPLLGVDANDVNCRLSDSDGRLVVELDLPASLPLTGLASRLDAARQAVREHFAALSGAELAAVRLRITHWTPAPERRVT